jgi:hypothetical protein
VALIARTLSPGSGGRLSAYAVAAVSTALLWLAILATPVQAVVKEIAPSTTVGLQPRSTELFTGTGAGAESFANTSGNPVLPASKTYAIYWDPTDHYHSDWQGVIDSFFRNMGAASSSHASVFAVDAQYTDAANQHAAYATTFVGAYTDTDKYPTTGTCEDPNPLTGESYPQKEPDQITCLTGAQVEEELENFIAEHNLPKGMETIFYLLTPPGVTMCLDEGKAAGHCSDYTGSVGEASYKNSFCSYHSDINPDSVAEGDGNTILYAAIPWIAGGYADGHLASEDRRPGYECQDGGFDPSSKPIEEKESEPIQQEPNQVSCPSPDGYCDTGLADLIINQIAVEQQNVVTDPLLSSWKDPSGNEATDECRNFFAPTLGGSVSASEGTLAGTLYNQSLNGGSYYLNNAFNLASLKLPYPGIPCLPGVRLEPKFTAPNPVNAGEAVGFDGMESEFTLNEGTAYTGTTPHETYATYTWNFGDGSPEVSGYAPGAASHNSPETSPCVEPWLAPCAASTFHSYQYGGTYTVTLKITDTGGNTASVSKSVTVDGPLPPAPSTSSSSSSTASTSSTSSSSSSTTTSSGSGTAALVLPAPVAAEAVSSTSLKKVTRTGLPVRYSVNEQVTGTFEVLLAAKIAKRLHLHLRQANGLAAGTPPQVIVGKALLITTKGGRGSLKIHFSKKTGRRLRRRHKIPLLVWLQVRNASGATTAALSKITLHR